MGKSWEQIYTKVSQAAEEVKKKSREGKLLSQREAALVREKELYDRLEKGKVIVATKPIEPEKNPAQQKNVPPVAPAKKTPVQPPVTAVPSPPKQTVVPHVPVQAKVSGKDAAAFMSTQYVAPSQKTTQEIADLYVAPPQPPQQPAVPQVPVQARVSGKDAAAFMNTQYTEKTTDDLETALQKIAQESQQTQIARQDAQAFLATRYADKNDEDPEVVLQNLAQEAQLVQAAQPQPELQQDPPTQQTPENTAQDDDAQNEQLQNTPPQSVEMPSRRVEWHEVQRDAEVFAFQTMREKEHVENTLEGLGIAVEGVGGEWHWTGENKKIVFCGDVVTGSRTDWIDRYAMIGSLAEQAEKQEGDVHALSGTGELALINFLANDTACDEQWISEHVDELAEKYGSLSAFGRFANVKKLKRINTFSDQKTALNAWKQLFERSHVIRENLLKTDEGRQIVENLCALKIASIVDDVLYMHMQPTEEVIEDLLRHGDVHARVNEINQIFQNGVREMLTDGKELSQECKDVMKMYVHFSTIRDNAAHLNTADNNVYQNSDEDVEKMMDRGINMIMCARKDDTKASLDADDFVFVIPNDCARVWQDGIMLMELGQTVSEDADEEDEQLAVDDEGFDEQEAKSATPDHQSTQSIKSQQTIQPPQQPLQPEQKVDVQKIEQGIKKIGDELEINVQYDQIANDPDAEAIVDKVHRALAAADHVTVAKVFDVVALMTKETSTTSGGDKLLLQYTLPQQEMVASIDRVTQEAIQKQRDALVKKYNIPPQYGEVFRNVFSQMKDQGVHEGVREKFFSILKLSVDNNKINEKVRKKIERAEIIFDTGTEKSIYESDIKSINFENGNLLVLYGTDKLIDNNIFSDSLPYIAKRLK